MNPAERLAERLDGVERRFALLAAGEAPLGLTDADPGTGEQWEAGQVWAHVAEFVPYWTEQARTVLASESRDPAPFGRVRTDPERIAAIERDRTQSPVQQLERLTAGVVEVRRFLGALRAPEWERAGLHPTKGVMTVERIIEEFVVDHLEEHAEQLERLAEASA